MLNLFFQLNNQNSKVQEKELELDSSIQFYKNSNAKHQKNRFKKQQLQSELYLQIQHNLPNSNNQHFSPLLQQLAQQPEKDNVFRDDISCLKHQTNLPLGQQQQTLSVSNFISPNTGKFFI